MMERIVETPHADLRETKAVLSAVPLSCLKLRFSKLHEMVDVTERPSGRAAEVMAPGS
jgi:hypothetical protein